MEFSGGQQGLLHVSELSHEPVGAMVVILILSMLVFIISVLKPTYMLVGIMYSSFLSTSWFLLVRVYGRGRNRISKGLNIGF